MIERRLTLPVEAERLWDELTDPHAASQWMGGTVEWELVPGGPARFEDGDQVRQGRIDDVQPGRRLRFSWWPEGRADGGEASEVTYDLRPGAGGTELVVTERRLVAGPAGPSAAAAVLLPASAHRPATALLAAAPSVLRPGDPTSVAWSAWDTRLLRAWARVGAGPLARALTERFVSAGADPGRPPAGDVWAALSDPTRRHLLDQLSQRGPLTATELAPEYPVSRQAVAKHLAALSGAGLVDAERDGRDVRYRVVPDRLDTAAAWLAAVGARWDRRLAALQARLVEPAPEPPDGPT